MPDMLHTMPAEATYNALLEAQRVRFRDHKLAAAYWSQLKARTQATGETLQVFAAAVSSW
jgi:hypothetical protein